MKKFDVENWNRNDQYEFFKSFEDPFFNVTANIEITNLYNHCKKNDFSFSLACLFVAIKSINEILEFRLRFKDNSVYLFDKVHIGSTILNDDFTFSFCDFKNEETLREFDLYGKEIISNHKKGLHFDDEEELGIVHCTIIPWISLTGFKHARRGDEKFKGIPKIVFGKLFEENGLKKIPFSVEVHHALVDGYHVGLLFNKMQDFISDFE